MKATNKAPMQSATFSTIKAWRDRDPAKVPARVLEAFDALDGNIDGKIDGNTGTLPTEGAVVSGYPIRDSVTLANLENGRDLLRQGRDQFLTQAQHGERTMSISPEQVDQFRQLARRAEQKACNFDTVIDWMKLGCE